jgi:hypothetical protein
MEMHRWRDDCLANEDFLMAHRMEMLRLLLDCGKFSKTFANDLILLSLKGGQPVEHILGNFR